MVKNLPIMWETWVQSLGWENSLKKGMATHSSILAWRKFLGLYSPPGFSVNRILQARILEWVAIPFFMGSSQPRDQIQVS